MAGSESVAHLLAGALRAIARDGMPEDLEAFIEHRLAVDPPFDAFWRRATRAVTLAGVEIPQDGLVQLPYAQLNRDSARHLSFGHGIHFCLGAALARLEASVALRAVTAASRRAAGAFEVIGDHVGIGRVEQAVGTIASTSGKPVARIRAAAPADVVVGSAQHDVRAEEQPERGRHAFVGHADRARVHDPPTPDAPVELPMRVPADDDALSDAGEQRLQARLRR